MTDHSIKGKTVLIAGGGKNLGGLVARDLAAQGAKAIAVHYNSPASAAETEETLAAIRAAGAEAGGVLPEHQIDQIVTIQVDRGCRNVALRLRTTQCLSGKKNDITDLHMPPAEPAEK